MIAVDVCSKPKRAKSALPASIRRRREVWVLSASTVMWSDMVVIPFDCVNYATGSRSQRDQCGTDTLVCACARPARGNRSTDRSVCATSSARKNVTGDPRAAEALGGDGRHGAGGEWAGADQKQTFAAIGERPLAKSLETGGQLARVARIAKRTDLHDEGAGRGYR